MDPQRRTLLSAAAAAAGAVAGTAGCTGRTPGGRSDDRDLPDDCPTTQDLDVEWPAELTEPSVGTFVESYENAYYREVVVGYEPTTTIDEYGLEAVVTDGPTAVDDGYEVVLSGDGGVFEPGLHVRAEPGDPPTDADVVPFGEVLDGAIRDVLETAAEEGSAAARPGPSAPRDRVDEIVERIAALSGDVDTLDGPGDSSTLYVDVGGTTVELTVRADQYHGDYWWTARYYVDEHVVRRLEDDEGDPRDGDLLECRRDA